MEDEIVSFLKRSLLCIDSIGEYCESMDRYLVESIDKQMRKYNKALVIEKFFLSKIHEDAEIVLSSEEKSLIDRVLNDYEIKKDGESISVTYQLNRNAVSDTDEKNIGVAMDEARKLIQRPELLRESSLIMLLIRFEDAISGIVECLIRKYPEAYLSKKTISFSELISIGTDIENVKERFVRNQIEEFMRSSLSDWYKTLSGKHNVCFSFLEKDVFERFKEAYYRRNIIVHNGGVVNADYIKQTSNESVDVGEKLVVDREYIADTCSASKIVIIGTFWYLRDALGLGTSFERMLFDYGYECLVREQWDVARYINESLLENKNQDYSDILCEKINRWIAIKNNEGLDCIKDEIDGLDTSAMNPMYIAAKYALIDDFDMVTKCLDKAIGHEVPAWTVKEFPLYRQYRDSVQYDEFVGRHEEMFSEENYEPNKEDLEDDKIVAVESSVG